MCSKVAPNYFKDAKDEKILKIFPPPDQFVIPKKRRPLKLHFPSHFISVMPQHGQNLNLEARHEKE